MLYGIEQTTDLRDRQTRIKEFPNTKKGLIKAQEWAGGSGKLAFHDPRNHHHRLRQIYRITGPKPTWKKAYQLYRREMRGHSVYQRYEVDFQASAITQNGERI